MSILKQLKWLMLDQFMFNMSGGGGGGNTTSTSNTSNIPEYAKPYVKTMLGAAEKQIFNMDADNNITGFKPYKAYSDNPQDYVAQFSPMQKQSFQGAANLNTPDQFQFGSQMAGMSGLGSMNVAGQAAGAGNNYFNMATNPYATQAFMNPYLQNALDPALAESRRQYGITGMRQQGDATQRGAFGGSREALMSAENARNMNMGMNQMIGQGYNTAYDNAQRNMQFGSNLDLQGQQAALQGYGQMNQAAGTLGQLGQSQFGAQKDILNLQNTYGQQQQAQQQRMVDQAIQDYATAQQFPMMQLGNMSNLLRGLPMQSTSTQTYQAQPGIASQIGALGAGAIGVSKLAGAKAGGSTNEISKRGSSGIDEMHLHEMLSYKE